MALVQAFRPRVSFADLALWPDDGRRYELYDGEVREVPSPFPVHQIVTGLLEEQFVAYRRVHDGLVLHAPLDIVFTEYDVLQPDLLFFIADRRSLVRLRQVTRDRPDIAVEILSKGTARHDRTNKLKAYARFGVPEFWIVDPDLHTIEVFVLNGDSYQTRQFCRGDDVVQSSVAGGLAFSAASVFPAES